MELRAEPEEIRPIRAVLLARLRDDAVNDSEVGLLATALASLGSSPTEIGAIHAALLPRLDNPELTAYAASRLVDTAVLLIRHPSAEEDALRTVLLERLKDPDTAPDDLPGWAHAVLGLRPTPADIDPVRRWLLARLDDPELRDYVARSIARAVMYLEPTPEQVPDVRAHLVALALVHLTSVEEGNWLLESIMRLQPLPEELRAIRAALQAKLTDSELDLHPSETKMLAEALALAQPSRDDAGHLAAHAPADTETGATLRSQLPFDDWTYYLAAHQGRPQ
jgi:hypothetical protein